MMKRRRAAWKLLSQRHACDTPFQSPNMPFLYLNCLKDTNIDASKLGVEKGVQSPPDFQRTYLSSSSLAKHGGCCTDQGDTEFW